MISKEDGRIDFTQDPEQIERQIRAFDPWPGTYAMYGEKMLKIWQAQVVDRQTDAAPGTVIAASAEGIDAAAGGRILRILQLQMPGKKRMSAGEYLRGNSIESGTVLG